MNILRSVRVFAGLAALAAVATLTGCSSGSPAAPSISVSVTPASGTTLAAGATQTFTATVANDGTTTPGVTWTASIGTISSAGLYTAPTPVTTTSATITATSKTDTTKTGTAAVTLTPIAVSIPTTPTAIAGGATEAITATVTGDATLNQGVTWSITSGGGSLTSVTTTSVTYNAPLPTTTSTAVITATSKTDTSKTTTITIPLTPISVAAISPATVSLGTSSTQNFTGAAVSNDSSNSGVTWSISPTTGAGTIGSTTGVYTAPTTVISATATVTVTATSVKDPAKSQTATITLQPIAVAAVTPATVSLNGGGTQTFAGAAVTFDGSNSGVTWSISPSTGAGTIVSTTGAYTAPAVVSGSTPVTVTVTAKSVKDTTKSGTVATITLNPISISLGSTTSATLDGSQQYGGVTATIANDSSNSGISFTVAAGGGDIGSSSTTTTTITGAGPYNPIYYSPVSVPTATSTTITVASVKDPTKTATFTVTLNPAMSFTTPSSSTATLTAGQTNTAYSYQLVVAGGTGTKSFSLVSGAFPAGITMSSTGLITGTPTAVTAGASANVRVTDQSSNPSILNGTLTIAVTAAPLVFNTPTLPADTVGTAYSQTLTATGGTGSLTYAVNTGTLPAGLNIVGNQITGTPTADTAVAGTPLTFKVTDSATPTPATQTTGSVSLVVNPKPLTITTTTLPNGTAGTAYSYQLASTGGTGTVTWTKTAGTLPSPLTVSGSGLISGTVTSPTTASGLSFQATDTPDNGRTAQVQTLNSVSLTIAASTTGSISGNVGLGLACQGVATPPVTMTLNTTPTATVATTSNGAFSMTNVPNGTYTLTPSITGASSAFYPATQSVVVNSGTVTANYNASIGYTVAGTVAYTGSKTGRIYVYLSPTTCSGNSVAGTSIAAAGAFTIRGVQPGTYTLNAYMDNVGQGVQNITNPAGSTGSVIVAAASLTGETVTLSDPAAPVLTTGSGPGIQGVFPLNTAAVVSYSSITNGDPNNPIEVATSYTLQWSTSSTFTTVTGSKTFAATGANGTNIWIVNGLTNGTTYYFRASGTAGSSTSPFSAISSGIVINAPSTGVAVSGTVNYTGTATGPLYVGYFSGTAFYGEYIPTPTTWPQAFTVTLPAGTYQPIAILDQNNDGLVGPGDPNNTNGKTSVTFTGATTGQSLTLPSGNSAATVTTQYLKSVNGSNVNFSYSLNFDVKPLVKLPVAAALVSATNPNVMVTQDIGICTNCGGKEFNFSANISSDVPVAADSYGLQLTYSDLSTETLNPAVTHVLGASDLASSLSPQTGGSVSTTPTFTWVYPANASTSGNIYQFSICCGINGNIWQIPGNNSNSNGFVYTALTPPLTWGPDPTSSNNAAPSGGLTLGTNYSWQIQTQDTNQNTATVQVNYQP